MGGFWIETVVGPIKRKKGEIDDRDPCCEQRKRDPSLARNGASIVQGLTFGPL